MPDEPLDFLQDFASAYDLLELGGDDPVYPGPGPAKGPTGYTSIMPTGGIPWRWQTGKIAYITLQINVIVPDTPHYAASGYSGFAVALRRANTAMETLHEKRAWTLTSHKIELIQALQRPQAFGVTDGMHWVSFNLYCTVRQLPPAPEEE